MIKRAGKSNLKAMINFDVNVDILIGFTFHWAWIWVVFWSSVFYSVELDASIWFVSDGPLALEALWTLSFCGLLFGFVVLSALASRIGVLALHPSLMIASAALSGIGTLLVIVPDAFSGLLPLGSTYAIGAVATGLGSSVSFLLWGELMTVLGSRQTVVYFALSTVASALVYMVVVFVPPLFGRLVTAAFPVIYMAFFFRSSLKVDYRVPALLESTGEAVDRALSRRSLASLGLISLMFGLSYGFMKGLFVTQSPNLIVQRDLLNIVAMFLGSITIYVTMALLRMNFRKLTYQIALPLLAAGFLFFPLQGGFGLLGFALHQFGYQYFYTIIWALFAVFASRLSVSPTRIVCTAVFGVMLGQFTGSVIGAMVVAHVASDFGLAMVSMACMFVILVAALFGFSEDALGSFWIAMRPFDPVQQQMSKFKRACLRLSAARGLTPREQEIMLLLSRGRNRAAISEQLYISEGTAKTHIKNIYRKMGVHSQQALIDMIELDSKNV